MRKATLSCDHCGGPVTYQAPFCPFCRAAQSWDAHVVLRRGAILADVDTVQQPLPTRSSTPFGRRVDGGVLLEPSAGKIQKGLFPFDLRDACVRVRATALDAGATFGLLFRVCSHGDTEAGYDLQVFPAFRSFRLRRLLWHKGKLQEVVLHRWEHGTVVRPFGQTNDLELRGADAVFQIVINGMLTATVLDAAFCYGAVGWSAASESDVSQARIVVHRVDVCAVI